MKYQLTETAKQKWITFAGVLLLTGLAPMLLAGLIFEALGL